MDTNKVKDNTTKTNEAFKVTGNWGMQSKQLKSKFSQLTDADLKFEAGKENEMLKRMETKLKKSREEVLSIISKNKEAKA